jgi:hypothetical protein
MRDAYPSQSVYISPKKCKLKFVKIQEKEFDQTTNLTVKTSLKLQSNFMDDFKDIKMHYNFKSLNSSKYTDLDSLSI